MIGNMWRIVVLFSLLACLRQTVIAMPSTEELCAVIVDKKVIEECTSCFEEAGTLQQTPDDFRYCVGFSLPPMLAECSVRHHEEMRMQHGSPNIHPNHTNANLMPRCLTKAMLRLSRYIQREKIIARSGGDIVKTVATSTLVRQGGPALVGVVAQDALFAHAEMQTMIDSVASECLSKYQPKGSRNTEEEVTRRMSLKTLKKALTLDPEEEVEEEGEGEEEEMEEVMEERKGVRSYICLFICYCFIR
ncbi:uncharacterized protein LOC122256033 [Penaeus japonicus]|uniref:uncharacterized protein LOC122256033 n=1 Tax=Penaeus japonicus TaxID=27405 RepID=UPI001C70F3CB|nr:uncharacterized protein LOC122256033 [Penaeus japonicus]